MLIEFYGWAASGKSTTAKGVRDDMLKLGHRVEPSRTSYIAFVKFLFVNYSFVRASVFKFFRFRRSGILSGNMDLLLRLFDWLLQSHKTIRSVAAEQVFFTDHGLFMPLSRVGKRSGDLLLMFELADILKDLFEKRIGSSERGSFTVVFLKTGPETLRRRSRNRVKNKAFINTLLVKKHNNDFHRQVDMHNRNTKALLDYLKDTFRCIDYVILDNDREHSQFANSETVVSNLLKLQREHIKIIK